MANNKKENKYKHGLDYVGAYISDNAQKITDTGVKAFQRIKEGVFHAGDRQVAQARGNIFEYVEGAKRTVQEARKGNFIEKPVVTEALGDAHGEMDISFVNSENNLIEAQCKVSHDASSLVNKISDEKYLGSERWVPNDMYDSVEHILQEKVKNNTITPEEKDALNNLIRTNTSNSELDKICGTDGTLDTVKVDAFIRESQNKLFLEETAKFAGAVTLSSAIAGCVFSSISNMYKYFKNKQSLEDSFKNIGIDTAKSTGRGLLSAGVASSVKYIGLQTGSVFLRSGVNSLVIANGVIDMGKSIYYFQKGEISFEDLMNNVVAMSTATAASLLIHTFLPFGPLINLGATIVIHTIAQYFIKSPKDKNTLFNKKQDEEIYDNLKVETDKLELQLVKSTKENVSILNQISDFAKQGFASINEEAIKPLCEKLHITDALNTCKDFVKDVKANKKVKLVFGKQKQ